MLELFPEGFEELDVRGGLELAAYTDAEGEERLRASFGGVGRVDVAEGWESRWREHHRPVQIGGVWIGPPWHTPPAGTPAVVVDPGLAFGTGAHATTRLCIEALTRLDRGGVVDLGCGSGVLSIAAARLGFSPVIALDNDPRAVDATARNAAANGVRVDARLADVLEEPLPFARIAVANVTLDVVERLAPRLASEVVVTAGYLEGARPAMPGYRRLERRLRDGWAADVFERSQ
jgi:ribosomal protein L11 methyltransferase